MTPSTEPTSDPQEPVEPDIPTEDSADPTLELSILGNKVKVLAKDDVELAYIEYTWNDGEQKVIEIGDNEKRLKEEYIDILPGKNTLRVNVVDQTGKHKDEELEINGRVLPQIEFFITPEGNAIIIKVKCDDGIDHVEWRINGTGGGYIGFKDYPDTTAEAWASAGVYVEMTEDGKVTSMEYTYGIDEDAKNVLVYAYSLKGEPNERQGNIE